MSSGVELIIAALCNATLGVAMKHTVNNMSVPAESNSWFELYRSEDLRTIAALAKELNGKHLKVATFNNHPMSAVTVDHNNKNGTLIGSGVAFFVLQILQKKFNFSYEVVQPKKNLIMGGSNPEDSLIGLVSTGKVDMAAAFVPNILEFRKLVSFSVDLDEENWVMVMQRSAESPVGEGQLAPFTTQVWYLILISVISFGPCITVITHVRAKLMPEDQPPLPLYSSIWFVIGAFMKQASRLIPKATSTRMLFITWWLFIMLVSAFYTANLTVFLTLSKFKLEIARPIDLYLHDVQWVAKEGSAVQFTVTSPQTEEMSYLNEMVKKSRAMFYDSTNITEYLKLVDKGYVLIKSYNTVVHGLYSDYLAKRSKGVLERDRCTYVIAPNPFFKNLRGFIYPKDSKLKTLFDRALGIINQAGLVNMLKTFRLPSTNICPIDLQSKERQLRNTDLLVTYKIAVAGVCAAIAVFIGEIIVKRYSSPKCSERNRKKRTKFNENTTVHYYQDDDSKPPPYETIFGKKSKIKLTKNAHKEIVNGREYLVVNTSGGIRLVPMRTASALLYKVE